MLAPAAGIAHHKPDHEAASAQPPSSFSTPKQKGQEAAWLEEENRQVAALSMRLEELHKNKIKCVCACTHTHACMDVYTHTYTCV